jgi:hypothetical protein
MRFIQSSASDAAREGGLPDRVVVHLNVHASGDPDQVLLSHNRSSRKSVRGKPHALRMIARYFLKTRPPQCQKQTRPQTDASKEKEHEEKAQAPMPAATTRTDEKEKPTPSRTINSLVAAHQHYRSQHYL